MSGDVNEATIMFGLVPPAERSRASQAIVDEMRQSIPELYGVEIEFGSSGGMSGSSAAVELKFYGSDLDAIKAYADSARTIMNGIATLHDVNVSMREGKPEMRIVPDRDRLALMGFTMAEVGRGIQYANLGQVVTRYREGGDEYDVRIRLEAEDRSTRDKVTQIPVVSRAGVVTQIANLGDIEYERGPVSITRENRVRTITVTAQTRNRDTQGEVQNIQAQLRALEASMPHGYFIEYGGSYKDMQETFADLLLALVLAVLLIYMVMAAQFESFTHPLIVMFTVPLAFIGVAAGHMIMGHPLSVVSFIGIIVLFGIVVNNGIILVTTINQLRAERMSVSDAVVKASSLRLRPILITSLTTIFGMLPMALSVGQGSEMQSPLGTSVAFGLAASTLLTLFVVPVLYSIIDGVSYAAKVFMKRVFLGETRKKRKAAPRVAPATTYPSQSARTFR